jgi:hypothetical protein
MTIKWFLWQDTGLDFKIQIIQESGSCESIHATEESQGYNERSAGEKDVGLPLFSLSSLLTYDFSTT